MSSIPAFTPSRWPIDDLDYPDSDGEPMADREVMALVMTDNTDVLRLRHAADPLVHVGSNLMLYPELGNPAKYYAPDVFVTIGLPKAPPLRRYFIWELPPPTLVIELSSMSTVQRDEMMKKNDYERMGVAHYVLFDPEQTLLKPSLQGFDLVESRYQPMPRVPERPWREADEPLHPACGEGVGR